MERLPRKIYTYEFKLEAIRLVESGQSIAALMAGRECGERCVFVGCAQVRRVCVASGVTARREIPHAALGQGYRDELGRLV